MRLQQWVDNKLLRLHTTNSGEISKLFSIVDRDIIEAKRATSLDWQFSIAYNAALKLCTILLYAKGYRTGSNGHHYYTIQSLPLILGDEFKDSADYLDACRKKRNEVEYDTVGTVAEEDVRELLTFIEKLRTDVFQWLNQEHPELLKP
jgi:uncharacterized protein (UPF0332 family)